MTPAELLTQCKHRSFRAHWHSPPQRRWWAMGTEQTPRIAVAAFWLSRVCLAQPPADLGPSETVVRKIYRYTHSYWGTLHPFSAALIVLGALVAGILLSRWCRYESKPKRLLLGFATAIVVPLGAGISIFVLYDTLYPHSLQDKLIEYAAPFGLALFGASIAAGLLAVLISLRFVLGSLQHNRPRTGLHTLTFSQHQQPEVESRTDMESVPFERNQSRGDALTLGLSEHLQPEVQSRTDAEHVSFERNQSHGNPTLGLSKRPEVESEINDPQPERKSIASTDLASQTIGRKDTEEIDLFAQIQQLRQLVSSSTLQWRPISNLPLNNKNIGRFITLCKDRFALCWEDSGNGDSIFTVIDQLDNGRIISLRPNERTGRWDLIFAGDQSQPKLAAILSELRSGHLKAAVSATAEVREPPLASERFAPAATETLKVAAMSKHEEEDPVEKFVAEFDREHPVAASVANTSGAIVARVLRVVVTGITIFGALGIIAKGALMMGVNGNPFPLIIALVAAAFLFWLGMKNARLRKKTD